MGLAEAVGRKNKVIMMNFGRNTHDLVFLCYYTRRWWEKTDTKFNFY